MNINPRIAIGLFLIMASSGFLAYRLTRRLEPPIPAPPALFKPEPAPFLSLLELGKIRSSTLDSDPKVRATAMELLFLMKDPQAIAILRRAIAQDIDPEVRTKAVELLRKQSDIAALAGLISGLQDVEKGVRLTSLSAIANMGDPSAGPWVAEAAVKDAEPDVRSEALRTLAKLQERRTIQWQELVDQLRKEYERALKRSKRNE
ncbi:MAG: HEAT repeat domain-containing protein [Elusimicrobia bacterium]|nr:HEAT repeat domain-containing protein [Elusimicrobiota bacterium]